MAAFDFPSSPSVNQTYTANGVTWKWNGTMWMRITGAGYLEKIEEGNSKVEVDDSGSGNITATVDGTEALRIDSSGRLFLGTTTPGHAIADNLTISDSGDCGITLISGTSNYGALYFGDSGGNNRGQVEYSHSADSLHFYTAAAERLRIKSDGKIGINNTSPGAMLQVDYDEGNSEVGLRLRAYNASGSKTWQLSEINGNAGVFSIRNATNAQNILNIDGVNQRVGVNDSTPDATLSVGGSTAFIDVGAAGGNRGKIGYSSNDLYFGTSSSSGEFIFKNNVTSTDNPASSGTERLRITSAGHVLRPTMAAAAVTLSADSTTLTSFSSYTTIALNSEGFDNANNFNTSNYRFTAPETGFYNIGCNVQLENASRSGSGNRWMYLYPLINGIAPGTSDGGNQADFDPADTYYYSWNWSSIMKLSQNDYVEWKYVGNLTSANLRGGGQSVFYFYQVG